MNPYLTQKSIRSCTWRMPVVAICVFTAAIAAFTTVDFAQQGKWETVCAGMLIMALLLYPAYRNVRHIASCREARQIARHLAYRTEERISIEKLNGELSKPRLAKKLSRLIDHGFLQYVRIDVQAGSVVLTAPNQRLIDDDIVEMECPNCGAKNQVARGRVGRCVYCEQTLILHPNKRRRDKR